MAGSTGMSDPEAALAAYNKYRAQHPELFTNPPNPAFELVTDLDQQRAVGAGIMYQDSYSILLRDAVRFRNGYLGPYTRIVPAADHGGAAVLPLLDSKIVLIDHQRHATRVSHWEIPRGFAQGSESPEETARREIMEELRVPAPESSTWAACILTLEHRTYTRPSTLPGLAIWGELRPMKVSTRHDWWTALNFSPWCGTRRLPTPSRWQQPCRRCYEDCWTRSAGTAGRRS